MTDLPSDKAMAAALAIQKDLRGRKGFDHLIDSLELDTLAEIVQTHAEVFDRFLSPIPNHIFCQDCRETFREDLRCTACGIIGCQRCDACCRAVRSCLPSDEMSP